MIIGQDEEAGLGVMGAIENLSKIFGCINSAYSAFNTIGGLLGFVQGSGGTAALASAIQALAQAIEKGMQDIVDAVQEQTLQQQWQPYANQLKAWHDTAQMRLDQLNSISQDAAGDVWLQVAGRRVSLLAWCAGYEDEHGKTMTGVLDDLGDLVEAFAAWPATGGTGAPSPLVLWDELCAAVIKADTLKSGEIRFTMMFAWYQSLYSLLSTVVYVRNVALQLYQLTKPGDSTYVNLDSQLELLGDVSTAGTVWAAFDAMFQSYLKLGALEDDQVCAIGSGDVASQDIPTFFMHPGDGNSLTALWLERVSLPADPPQVLTSLRFRYYDTTDNIRVLYLEGVPCQVLAGGGLTPLPAVNSLPAGLDADDVIAAIEAGKAIGAWDLPHNTSNDINIAAGYVSEPPPTGSDEITNVIVGFGFTALGNAAVLD
ncbi:MAG: hypothetical protein K0R83_1850, partial [Caulobacter sp.]|nr:hypothetical protein [Caulobacter sp.]